MSLPSPAPPLVNALGRVESAKEGEERAQVNAEDDDADKVVDSVSEVAQDKEF